MKKTVLSFVALSLALCLALAACGGTPAASSSAPLLPRPEALPPQSRPSSSAIRWLKRFPKAKRCSTSPTR